MTRNRFMIWRKVTYSRLFRGIVYFRISIAWFVRYLITGILILCVFFPSAQKVLVLEKIGKGRYFTFREGEMIRLSTRIGQLHIQDQITQVNDSSIIVQGNFKIALDNILYIEKIYKNRKGNGIKLMIAGGLLVTITSINNSTNNEQVIDPLFLSISVGLASTGLVWYSLGKRKYRIGDQWKWKVLDSFL